MISPHHALSAILKHILSPKSIQIQNICRQSVDKVFDMIYTRIVTKQATKEGGVHMINPNPALKQRIISKYGSEAEMARCIKWPRQRLNKITNGIKVPDVDEISTIASALGLSISATAKFFLAD